MSQETAEPATVHPTSAELLADFGDEYLSIQSLFNFCFVPGGRLNLLKDLTLEEEWGSNNFVLLKYLAVHVRLAIEQERYVWNGDQIVLTAGRLTTPSGTPIYLGLVKNSTPDENPWVLNWVGERPSCAELPEPVNLGVWPSVDAGSEVVIACDLSNGERRVRIPEIGEAPVTTQLCALAGAIQWSLHRGLAVRQIHGGGRGYFVPLFLTNREDLTLAPDLVAPLLVQSKRLVVRTFLEPHVAYSPARAVVERWEQLPAWLLEAWDSATADEERGEEAAAPDPPPAD
ncbi:MAG: hypothetical protein AB1726_08700 [Planctomycetota bacterium]